MAGGLVLERVNQSLLIGPLVSIVDGYTIVTTPILNSEILISKNYDAPSPRLNSTPSTHAYGGHHLIEIVAGDLSIVPYGEMGSIEIIINKEGAIPLKRLFPVEATPLP